MPPHKGVNRGSGPTVSEAVSLRVAGSLADRTRSLHLCHSLARRAAVNHLRRHRHADAYNPNLPTAASTADLSGLTSFGLLLLGRPEFRYQFEMGIEQTR